MTTGTTKTRKLPIGAMDVVGGVFTAMGAVSDIKAGKPIATTVLNAVASEIIYASPLGMPLMIAGFGKMGLEYGLQKGRENAQASSRAYQANFGGNYDISTNGATLRQRGLQAIENSNSNVRSVLGSEARNFHRSNFARGY